MLHSSEERKTTRAYGSIGSRWEYMQWSFAGIRTRQISARLSQLLRLKHGYAYLKENS